MRPYRIDRPDGCICVEFRDIMPVRISDMGCPVHGLGGIDEGDGYWKFVPVTIDHKAALDAFVKSHGDYIEERIRAAVDAAVKEDT